MWGAGLYCHSCPLWGIVDNSLYLFFRPVSPVGRRLLLPLLPPGGGGYPYSTQGGFELGAQPCCVGVLYEGPLSFGSTALGTIYVPLRSVSGRSSQDMWLVWGVPGSVLSPHCFFLSFLPPLFFLSLSRLLDLIGSCSGPRPFSPASGAFQLQRPLRTHPLAAVFCSRERDLVGLHWFESMTSALQSQRHPFCLLGAALERKGIGGAALV